MVAKVIPEVKTCAICPATFLVGGTGNYPRSRLYCSRACANRAGFTRTTKLCRDLPIEVAAYLAGMIDADGHIGIYGHGKASSTSRVLVSIANTDSEMLDWVKEVTGIGSVQRQSRGSDTYKTTYYWAAHGGSGPSLLAKILPYMIVKRARAELAIEYQEGLKDPVHRADVAWRERYRVEMLRLNKRGPVTE